MRVYISKNKKIKINKSVKNILKSESKFGVNNKKTYLNYQLELDKKKENVAKNIKWLKKKYKKLYGYGASAKATVSMNYFEIDSKYIDSMIDDNFLKIGKYIPGTEVKIISKKEVKKLNCIIVFAWNMFSEIKKSNYGLSDTFINIRDLYKENFIKKFSKIKS